MHIEHTVAELLTATDGLCLAQTFLMLKKKSPSEHVNTPGNGALIDPKHSQTRKVRKYWVFPLNNNREKSAVPSLVVVVTVCGGAPTSSPSGPRIVAAIVTSRLVVSPSHMVHSAG